MSQTHLNNNHSNAPTQNERKGKTTVLHTSTNWIGITEANDIKYERWENVTETATASLQVSMWSSKHPAVNVSYSSEMRFTPQVVKYGYPSVKYVHYIK